VNENWDDLVGPSNKSLVHWLRRLVFRGAWLDQRVKEGELDIVFDESTQTFGYVQPDRTRADRALRRAVLGDRRLRRPRPRLVSAGAGSSARPTAPPGRSAAR
jgi:hypothetical protein